jgi:hypothetical protein
MGGLHELANDMRTHAGAEFIFACDSFFQKAWYHFVGIAKAYYDQQAETQFAEGSDCEATACKDAWLHAGTANAFPPYFVAADIHTDNRQMERKTRLDEGKELYHPLRVPVQMLEEQLAVVSIVKPSDMDGEPPLAPPPPPPPLPVPPAPPRTAKQARALWKLCDHNIKGRKEWPDIAVKVEPESETDSGWETETDSETETEAFKVAAHAALQVRCAEAHRRVQVQRAYQACSMDSWALPKHQSNLARCEILRDKHQLAVEDGHVCTCPGDVEATVEEAKRRVCFTQKQLVKHQGVLKKLMDAAPPLLSNGERPPLPKLLRRHPKRK